MKTRILVSAISLAIAVLALPASAGLRIEGDPRAQEHAKSQSHSVQSSNYHEITFDDVGLAPTTVKSSSAQDQQERGMDKRGSLASGEAGKNSAGPEQTTLAPSSSVNPTAFSAYVSQSGKVPLKDPVRVSGGTDVLLSQALNQVIPSDFRLLDNQVHLRKLATWTGNRSWVDVLADLGRAANFVSHINWDTHEVSLAPAPASLIAKTTSEYKPLPPQVQEVRETHEIQVVDKPTAVARTVPVFSTPAPPPVSIWSLDSTKTLRDNVDAWAKKAGWTLVWDAVDYPIFAPASFQGDFSASDGPLAQLFSGYRDSDQPLLVRLTSKDKVVYVRNRVLERSEITGLPPAIPDGTF